MISTNLAKTSIPVFSQLALDRRLRDELEIYCATQLQPPDRCPVDLTDGRAVEVDQVEELYWFEVLLGDKQELDWERSTAFLKAVSVASGRMGFCLLGNKTRIRFLFGVETSDLSLFLNAFETEYHASSLGRQSSLFEVFRTLKGIPLKYKDYFCRGMPQRAFTPEPPPNTSPLRYALTALRALSSQCLGVVQCLFVPNRDRALHQKLRLYQDLEYLRSLQLGSGGRVDLQMPSNALHPLANALLQRCDEHQPLFAVALRVAVTAFTKLDIDSLAAYAAQFFHDDQHLGFFDEKAFEGTDLSTDLAKGYVRRQGFLLNASELTRLVHLPTAEDCESCKATIEFWRSINSGLSLTDEGTVLGFLPHGQEVRIPSEVRARGVHLVANSGMGKSTLLLQMLLQDFLAGNGGIFIDPHGEGLLEFIDQVPKSQIQRVIYFNPCEPVRGYVPLWNPLKVKNEEYRYRQLEDLLASIAHVSKDWGDRLGMVLKNGLIGLSYLKDATLLDLYHLTRQRTNESQALIFEILENCPDEIVTSFWSSDFSKSYREVDLASSRHKLQKLLVNGPASKMFCQPENAFDLKAIMKSGKLLLVDLSDLGSESQALIGSFWLVQVFVAGLARKERRPFSVFVDEAHLFTEGRIFKDYAAQARKFGLQLVVAHQYLKQFPLDAADSLSSMGASIIGRVDKNDAHYFEKFFQGKVSAGEIQMLEPFEMVGRLGSELARFKTRPFPPNKKDQMPVVRKNSFKRYYKRQPELLPPAVGKSSQGMNRIHLKQWSFNPEELAYEEFED